MNKRLFVAGIPFSATQDELKDLFTQAGSVASVNIIIDKFSGRSKGFGFVEMATEEEAAAAIAKLNDSDFGGRKLIVAEAKPMEKREFSDRGGDRRGGPGGGRGGFGGGRRDDRGRGHGGGFGGRGRDQRGGGRW